jgi:hypothetical protein
MAEDIASQPRPKSRSLFHYTTAQGLLGIVKDRCLFATHADFSNDSSECKLILPHLIKVVAEEYKQCVTRLIASRVMSEEILHEHGQGVFEEEARNTVGLMLQAVNNTAPYFITSFCVHDESSYEYSNGLLSQWRSYARGGFAIEFDEFAIDALNNEEMAGWCYQGMITNNVAYENHELHVKPSQFKGMAGAFLRAILPDNPKVDEILGTARIDDFARAFLSVAPFLKHFGFREESEYRIVALCSRPTRRDPGEKRANKEIQFRSRQDGNVIPYIALYEGLRKPLPIKSVIVGPHAHQENQRLAVELLLERYNVDADVRVSETPFRE